MLADRVVVDRGRPRRARSAVDVPRPRHRGDAALAALEGRILDHLFRDDRSLYERARSRRSSERTPHAAARRPTDFPLVPADARRRPLSRLERGRPRGALAYLRQIAQAADDLGYFGVLLPTGRSLRGFLGRRRGPGAAHPAAALSRRRAARACSRPTAGGADDRDPRPHLGRAAADQRRHRRRSGRERGRRRVPRRTTSATRSPTSSCTSGAAC